MTTKGKTKKVKVEKVEEEAIPQRYTADIILVKEPYAKNERLAQISWYAAGDKLALAIQDTQYSSELEQLIKGNIVTAEGRTYNPFSQPKEWVLNLSKVAPNKLWNKWGATEAKASYEN